MATPDQYGRFSKVLTYFRDKINDIITGRQIVGKAMFARNASYAVGSNGKAETNPIYQTYAKADGTAATGIIQARTIPVNDSTTNNNVALWGVMADNDAWGIRAGGTADNGWFELATSDNGNEPIYVSQYASGNATATNKNGGFTNLLRRATLLDGAGNTNFPGTLTANLLKATGSDYAEWYPRGEMTEPGDVVVLDMNSDEERYCKSNGGNRRAVGVHSNCYGMLIGKDGAIETHIPVALKGRVPVKVKGTVHKNDYLVVDGNQTGVARAYDSFRDTPDLIFAIAIESHSGEDIALIKAHIR